MATAVEELRFEIPGGRDAAANARHALEEALAGELSARLLYLVVLLGSELVADSVRHGRAQAGARVALAVRRDPEHIRVEVMDQGPGVDVEPPAPDFPGGSPWSVFLIDQLADRWGADAGEGMTVWAEISRTRWERDPAAAGATRSEA